MKKKKKFEWKKKIEDCSIIKMSSMQCSHLTQFHTFRFFVYISIELETKDLKRNKCQKCSRTLQFCNEINIQSQTLNFRKAAILFKNRLTFSNAFFGSFYMLFIAPAMICSQSMTRNVWFQRHSFVSCFFFFRFVSRMLQVAALHRECENGRTQNLAMHSFSSVAEHLKHRLFALFEFASIFWLN